MHHQKILRMIHFTNDRPGSYQVSPIHFHSAYVRSQMESPCVRDRGLEA